MFCICQPYSSVLEVHVKWFLNELLVSLIMPLLSSKSVDVYIVYHFYFPEAFIQVKKLMEKTYSETEPFAVTMAAVKVKLAQERLLYRNTKQNSQGKVKAAPFVQCVDKVSK
jgi:hypothetical protein